MKGIRALHQKRMKHDKQSSFIAFIRWPLQIKTLNQDTQSRPSRQSMKAIEMVKAITTIATVDQGIFGSNTVTSRYTQIDESARARCYTHHSI